MYGCGFTEGVPNKPWSCQNSSQSGNKDAGVITVCVRFVNAISYATLQRGLRIKLKAQSLRFLLSINPAVSFLSRSGRLPIYNKREWASTLECQLWFRRHGSHSIGGIMRGFHYDTNLTTSLEIFDTFGINYSDRLSTHAYRAKRALYRRCKYKLYRVQNTYSICPQWNMRNPGVAFHRSRLRMRHQQCLKMFQRPCLTHTRLRRWCGMHKPVSIPPQCSQLHLLSLRPQHEPVLTPVFSNVTVAHVLDSSFSMSGSPGIIPVSTFSTLNFALTPGACITDHQVPQSVVNS